jgi:hypothetical protein
MSSKRSTTLDRGVTEVGARSYARLTQQFPDLFPSGPTDPISLGPPSLRGTQVSRLPPPPYALHRVGPSISIVVESIRLPDQEATFLRILRPNGPLLGSAAFRKELLERMEGDLGASHAGELRRESAEVRAERIIAEELRWQGWDGADLAQRRKSDPVKLALAARLRTGTSQSTATRLQEFKRRSQTGSGK